MKKIDDNKWNKLLDKMVTRIGNNDKVKHYGYVYGVPKNGTIVALEVARRTPLQFTTIQKPGCLVVDDLIDSGRTREKYKDYDFEVLINKQTDKEYKGEWIQFWFENTEQDDKDLVLRFAQRLNIEVKI